MNTKENYYQLLKSDKGRSNEIELGERLGLNETQTQEMIALLLSENRILYKPNHVCNYSIMKSTKNHYEK